MYINLTQIKKPPLYFRKSLANTKINHSDHTAKTDQHTNACTSNKKRDTSCAVMLIKLKADYFFNFLSCRSVNFCSARAIFITMGIITWVQLFNSSFCVGQIFFLSVAKLVPQFRIRSTTSVTCRLHVSHDEQYILYCQHTKSHALMA